MRRKSTRQLYQYNNMPSLATVQFFAVLAIFSYLGFNDMSVLGILFLHYICELLYCTYKSWINFIIIISDAEKEYTATLPVAENVAWAWMIFFAYLLPELGSFIRSTRMCIFKVRCGG